MAAAGQLKYKGNLEHRRHDSLTILLCGISHYVSRISGVFIYTEGPGGPGRAASSRGTHVP